MGEKYFSKLHQKTKTRFWINNPTSEDLEKALENDAFCCTTNPAYCSKLIAREKDYIDKVIDENINYTNHYDELANAVYRTAAKRIMDAFMPVYEKSNGKSGYVTVQDDPRYDTNTDHIMRAVLKNKQLAPNYMAKIPAIDGGIQAIEECVRLNIPVTATEIFGVSQASLVAERYETACKHFGNRPPFYLTHITGIFDEYLGKLTKRRNIDIDPEVLKWAGIAVARKQYHTLKKMGYTQITMLGGGARALHHFTELVGDPHITINWSTAQEILDLDIEVEQKIDQEVPQSVIEELRAKFSDFMRVYDDDGMMVQEYADFGPIQLFRNAFLMGWYQLLAEIAQRKHMLAK